MTGPTTRNRTAGAGDLCALVARVEQLALAGPRVLLGIVGAPGVGKSTFAAALAHALGERAVIVPMDGFHLANVVLAQRAALDRKGAIDTFDGAGFLSLVQRLASHPAETVYAPEYRREIEEGVAGAIPVPPEAEIVIVEGNYLLVDDGPWAGLAELFTECWFLDLDDITRVDQLQARHRQFGDDPETAARRALGNDQRNAVLINSTKSRADRVIDLGVLREFADAP